MRHVPTLVPTDLWFRTLLILFAIISIFIWTALYYPDSFRNGDSISFWSLGIFGFLTVTILDFYLRRGYKISFDDDAIYWRKVGIRRGIENEISMPFGAITEVFSESGTLGIKPFEAVVLRAGNHDIPGIILSRMYLRDSDIRDILEKICKRAEAILEEEVRDFL